MTAAPVSEFPYVEEYLDVLLRHGRKHITTDRYRQILGMILRGLHDMGRTTDPHKISEDDVYAVFASLNVVESSKVSYLYILRQWCRFYTNREVEQVRLLVNHEIPKRRWISEEDVSVSLHTTTHPQDRLIIYLGSAYGLRRGEIATLKGDDLHRDHMIVHGKGHGDDGKIRKVPLLPNDGDLRRYLDWRQRTVAGCLEDRSGGALLIVCIKRTVRAVTPEWVGRRARSSFVNVGVDGTTHSLRRAFITEAYDAGARIVDIMRVVGHESYNTTVKYISDDPRRAAQVVALRNGYISHNGYVSNEREFESRNI